MLQEICDDPQFVSEGASRFDVQQGELGRYNIEKKEWCTCIKKDGHAHITFPGFYPVPHHALSNNC